ncbi:MAG: NAD(P)-binding domain-containing protein, partial [Hasllibacter sp.]
MDVMDEIARRGLLLLGCGRMGSAMLAGWLARGVDAAAVHVVDPVPSDWLKGTGVRLGAPPAPPAIAVIAVKPQMMDAALPALTGGDTLFVSVAAGVPIARFEAALGAGARVVRAMPNTPAAIGRGITAIVANDAAGRAGLDAAEALLSAVGE